jgi:hypothetical protein
MFPRNGDMLTPERRPMVPIAAGYAVVASRTWPECQNAGFPVGGGVGLCSGTG